MSAVAADLFHDDVYQAPGANLIDHRVAPVKDRAFSSKGRLGVLSYAARAMAFYAVVIISGAPLLIAYLVSQNGDPSTAAMIGSSAVFLIGFVGGVVYFVLSTIKRLHDLGYSGWYYLLMMVPLIGSILLLFISLKPGKADANKFGVTKQTTTSEKVLGIAGLCIGLLVMVGAMFADVGSLAGV